MFRNLVPIRMAAIVSVCVYTILLAVFTDASDDCPKIKPKVILCPGHQATNCGPTRIINGIPVCNPVTYKSVNNHPLTNESNGQNETNTMVDPIPNNKVTCWETGLCGLNPLTQRCFKMPFSADHKVNPLILVDC